MFLVARTTQAIGDINNMGILSVTTAGTNSEAGFHLYKTSSTCVNANGINGGQSPDCAQGKFTQFRYWLWLRCRRSSLTCHCRPP